MLCLSLLSVGTIEELAAKVMGRRRGAATRVRDGRDPHKSQAEETRQGTRLALLKKRRQGKERA